MAVLRSSIEKLITDALLARIRGQADLSLPDGLNDFDSDKDRRIPVMPGKKARLSMYALQQKEPQAIGNTRKPMMLSRMLQLEIRVLLRGDDDALDAFRQWINLVCGTAEKLPSEQYPEGLTLSIREAESATALTEDSGGEVLAHMSRWWVEFTTLPTDLTTTGRSLA